MTARWRGKTVVVLGSGPSLTTDDIAKTAHLPTIAVNSTWKIARHCEVIYAGDEAWWRCYGSEIDIPADRYTLKPQTAATYGIKSHENKCGNGYNSGLMAIKLALHEGAERVLLLGFDCSIENGTHHHGDHEKTINPDKRRCLMWRNQFDQIDPERIINCSRHTEITRFKRMPLELAL
jgi:uncharacterized Rossmann fold enzyme